MVFRISLSHSKSPQVSRTLLGLNNIVVWMVSTHSLIFKSSTPFYNPTATVPRVLITIGIDVTFMFHNFFNSLPRLALILLFFFFQFYSVDSRDSKVYYSAVSLFLLIITRSGRLTEMKWSVCMLKSYRSSCVSFPRTDAELCIYHLFLWSNSKFLHNSQWITLPTQSCLVLYSFWANLLHSLIMWLMVSSLSPHNLHLFFCCVLSILALI